MGVPVGTIVAVGVDIGGVRDGDIDGIRVGVGDGIPVGVGEEVGVAVGVGAPVASSATWDPAAKTENFKEIRLNIPRLSVVSIVIVWFPGASAVGGLKVQMPFASAVTVSCITTGDSIVIFTVLFAPAVPLKTGLSSIND